MPHWLEHFLGHWYDPAVTSDQQARTDSTVGTATASTDRANKVLEAYRQAAPVVTRKRKVAHP